MWHPARREEQGLAVGLRLPTPAADAVYEFSGHRLSFATAAGDRYLALASFGSGNTSWHLNAGGDFGSAHLRHVCPCVGLASQAARTCSGTVRISVTFVRAWLPSNTAEERLCARDAGYFPPPPGAIDLADSGAAQGGHCWLCRRACSFPCDGWLQPGRSGGHGLCHPEWCYRPGLWRRFGGSVSFSHGA